MCWGISFEEFCIRNLAIKHNISLRKSAKLYFQSVNPFKVRRACASEGKEKNIPEAKAEKDDDPKNINSVHENRVEDQQGEPPEEGKGSK